MKHLTARHAFIICLGLYTILALAQAALTPLTTGPDELAHYEYVNFIATHGRLPLTHEERAHAGYKSDQPPLFHLIAAIPASWVDTSGANLLKRASDSPRRALIERTRHAWGLYNTEDEGWPYHGEVLRWQIGRWVAIAFGLISLILTFFMARAILLNEWLALATAATIGFIPRFILTGSMLNYETLTTCLATLAWWQIWRMSQSVSRSASQQVSLSLMLGLLVGLTIITKLSAIILPLEVVIALILINRYQDSAWQSLLQQLTLAALGCFIILSLWFGFVVYQFNTVAQEGWWTGLLRPLIAADSSDATTNRLLNLLTGGEAGFTEGGNSHETGSLVTWIITFYRTFWAVGIEGQQPLVPFGLFIIIGFMGLALYGLWQRYQSQPACRLTLQLLALHSLLPILLPLLRFMVTGSLADSAQGRHLLFLAAPTLALMGIWGLSYFRPYSLFLTPYSLLPLFLFFWTLTQTSVMTWAYNPPLPVSITAMPIAHPIKHRFTDAIELLGYEYQVSPDQLQVTLMWHATALSSVDYLTEINLQDAQGHVMSQWLGYPTNGRYPSRAWDKGDFVRDTAWLPLAGLSAGSYQLSVNLRPMSLAHPAPTEAITLANLNLNPSPATNDIQLWQSGQATSNATFHDREVILITAPPDHSITLITAQQTFSMPLSHIGHTWLFMVAPDWPSGQYQVADTPLTFQVNNTWPRQFSEPPMSHRVEANFANQVKLLGYDLPNRRAAPGGDLPLTLYWQGLDWLGNDYTIFIKPIAIANETAYGGRDRLPRENYRTLYWSLNEIVTDPFAVPISANAPNGLYNLHIGLYHVTQGQINYLPLMQDNQPQEATSITIGPVKIGTIPSDFTLTSAQPQYPMSQSFGDNANITLLGYDLEQESITAATLRFYWQCNSPLPLDYTLFVHVLNAAGQTIAQHDEPPPYPTGLWDTGEMIANQITLTLPPDLPPGRYSIVIGLYDFNTGQRLTIPHQPDNSLTLPTAITLK